MDKAFAVRTQEEMREVLMDPSSVGPNIHYFMIRGGTEKKNITVWESGLVGEEYIKTYGHYHVNDFIETYKVLSGEGIILLQKRRLDSAGMPMDEEVESVKAIFVKAGSVVPIPERDGHLAVNTGDNWFVTEDDSPVDLRTDKEQREETAWPKHADYAPVKKMQGFAYYVVQRDGKPAFVKNPHYKNTPEILIGHA